MVVVVVGQVEEWERKVGERWKWFDSLCWRERAGCGGGEAAFSYITRRSVSNVGNLQSACPWKTM